MEVGDKFTHKYSSTITCEITGFTDKGYKVQQTEGKKKPKQAFFDKPDFDVKNGFWVKQQVTESKPIKQDKGLKYPTFRDFLQKLDSLEKIQFSGILSVQLEDFSQYYFNPDFHLDGIHVQLFFDKYQSELCKVKIAGSTKVFEKSDKFTHVIDMSVDWIYKKYFQYSEDELAGYNVFDKGFYDSKSQFFPRDDQFIGYFNALNYEKLLAQLKQKGIDLKTVMIEKAQYSFLSMQGKLTSLEI